jgi:uncharacterized delta-60 repeat protein
MRRYVLFPLIFLVQAQSCGFPDPPRPEQVSMVRRWEFHQLTMGSLGESPVEPPGLQIGGIVNESHNFGALTLLPPGAGPDALSEVFSDALGRTYWVSTQAAHGGSPHPDAIGTVSRLSQYQVFRKDSNDARLTVVVSRTFLDGIDANGTGLLPSECRWTIPVTPPKECNAVIRADVSFDLRAFAVTDGRTLLNTGGHARLQGWQGNWGAHAYTNHDATRPFWNDDNFILHFFGILDSNVQLELRAPIAISIPLGSLGIGERFELHSIVEALAYTRRQRESYASAYFRDPQQPTGVGFDFTGLTPMRTPSAEPVPRPPSPAPACSTGPDPAAGILQFDTAEYAEPELAGRGATIVVTRSGGSRGAVSASLTTADGTAVSGSDYSPLTTSVLFADGEEGSRAVRIPILVDDIAESDKTLNLVLSAPMGCASLGVQTSAVLTIMDDDRPIAPPQNFTVGGTVSGLVGTGLVLQEITAGSELTATNGPFTFDRALADGIPYDVRIGTQPINPLQVCTVTNGTGTIAGADVTNVVVQCETQSTGGDLDPGFAGGGGIATTGLPGGATAMALQADGKIVLAGGRTLTRYNADGTIDAAFGNAGSVTVAFGGGGSDVVQAVAIQPDDLIVVAGFTNAAGHNDFVVARYTAGGLPDSSFGTGGFTRTDFSGTTDRALAVLIQPDGAIVLAGHAGTSTPLGLDNDFAVARYTSGGALDGTFGTGGKVTTNIAGRTDLGAAAVLQSDGRIVVSGRVADGGGDNPDVGLVRYNVDGTRDASFGVQGIVRTLTGGWDEASGMALQPDGKIVVSMAAVVGTTFVIAAARFDDNGSPDLGFGAGGVASTLLSTQMDVARDVAIQADGKIVVVGQKSTNSLPDIAVLRYLPNGTLDSSFGNGGILIVDVFADVDNATCVVIQPDGKIVVGGFARNGTTTGLALLRILQ